MNWSSRRSAAAARPPPPSRRAPARCGHGPPRPPGRRIVQAVGEGNEVIAGGGGTWWHRPPRNDPAGDARVAGRRGPSPPGRHCGRSRRTPPREPRGHQDGRSALASDVRGPAAARSRPATPSRAAYPGADQGRPVHRAGESRLSVVERLVVVAPAHPAAGPEEPLDRIEVIPQRGEPGERAPATRGCRRPRSPAPSRPAA